MNCYLHHSWLMWFDSMFIKLMMNNGWPRVAWVGKYRENVQSPNYSSAGIAAEQLVRMGHLVRLQKKFHKKTTTQYQSNFKIILTVKPNYSFSQFFIKRTV